MLKNITGPLDQLGRKSVLALTVIFAVSLLLRLYRLGSHDLWYDEASTALYTDSPWRNWNAPLYWVFLYSWAKIFGSSEFSLRFPSALFSALTTGIVFLLGKELFNKRTAILAAVLTGLSAFHLWYGQEARDYSMVLLFGTLSSYALFLSIRKGGFKSWLAFVLISLVGIYTNYFYLFLVASQFLYTVYVVRSRAWKVYLSFLFIAVAFSFWVSTFLSKFMYVSKGFWVPKPHWQSLMIVLQNYMLGYSGTQVLYALASLVTLVAFILLFWFVRKRSEVSQSISFCVFLLFIPLGLAFLFSKLFFSVYLNRGFLLFSPYFYLLVAYVVTELRREIMVAATCLLVLIFSCGTYLYFHDHVYSPLEYHTGTYLKKPIRPIISFLDAHVREGDLIGLTNPSVGPGMDFYAGKRFRRYYLFSPQIVDSSWQRPVRESSYSIPTRKIAGLDFKRMWVLSSDWGRSGLLDENSTAVKQWLDENLRLLSSQELDGLRIYCYEKRDLQE